MSKYSKKVARRLQEAEPPKEPTDDYSIIPDASLRRYFRARAGMYDMTKMRHRSLKIEIGKTNFRQLLRRRKVRIHLAITYENAEVLGELFREQRKERQRVDVWSHAYGARTKAVVIDLKEEAFHVSSIPALAIKLRPKLQFRPVTRKWRRSGIFAASTTGIVI